MELLRIGGALLCYLWLVWSAANIDLLHAPATSGLQEIIIYAGLTLGNFFYAQFLIAEGRLRERRDRGNIHGGGPGETP